MVVSVADGDIIYGCIKCADNSWCSTSNAATSVSDVTGAKANPTLGGCNAEYF